MMNRVAFAILSALFLFKNTSVAELNCPSKKTTFARRQYVGLLPSFLGDTIQVHETPPSACFDICVNDVNCTSFFANHRTQSCTVTRGNPDIVENHIAADFSTTYHRKICLQDQCKHQWAFDVIKGVKLFRYEDKTVQNVLSIEKCMELCANEPTFRCRSSWFDSRHSRCVLSRHDRRSAPEVFRKSLEDVTYLERQCAPEPTSCQFRARRSRSLVHQYVHVAKDAKSKDTCENACLNHSHFPCRSYQFDTRLTLCLLSPEDSYSLLLRPVTFSSSRSGHEENIYEKESCIEVEVKCESTALTVRIKVTQPFRGRIYAAEHPYDCYSVNLHDESYISLSMPLHRRSCGTKNLGNGTFINSVVVQHHPFVLRTSDRKIDIACDYEEMKQKLRSSKGVKDGELKPMSHIVTAVAPTPPIRLRVVNSSDQDVSGVELGDPLFLKVELADESVYGIFGSDLIARSSAGSETVLLIDDNGCPVEPSVIPSLDRLPGSKSLIAPFQAFKFASDAAVKFQMTVSYCLDICLPADCGVNVGRETPQRSYGRRKRAAVDNQVSEYQPGDVITDVTMETDTFFVTNMESSLGPAKSDNKWVDRDIPFLEPEGHVRVPSPARGICISSTTLYVIASAAGILQLGILFACAFFFFCGQRNYDKPSSITSKSSMSSCRKFYTRA